MKKETIIKLIELLKTIKDSGLSISEYCRQNGESANSLYVKMNKVKKNLIKGGELFSKAVSLYNEITGNRSFKEIEYSEEITDLEDFKETDELAGVTIIRSTTKFLEDEPDKGMIIGYKVQAKVRDSKDFITTLTREDAEQIFGLYTYYGGNITARNVANEFPKYTLSEIKKIFRAFKLTKDSAWYPPHLGEEMNIEELNQYRMNLKERAAFKYTDSRRELDYNKIIKDLSDRLKKAENFNDFLEKLSNKEYPEVEIEPKLGFISRSNNDTMILFLSDMHIGAKVESGSLFQNKYDLDEVKKRLDIIVDNLLELSTFKRLIVVNLGDSIDGWNQTTSRMSQIMPQNMDNFEQVSGLVDSIIYFFSKLIKECIAEDYQYLCVKCGNHPGAAEWVTNKLICSRLKEIFGSIISKAEVADTDFLNFWVDNHMYLCHHGRDAKNMKSHFPLNLDSKWESQLTDYIFHTYSISPETKINVVSGDLHNEAMNRGKFFKYWKVGSFFGASDYCMANYGNTPAHVNYHIINNDNVLFGTIELQ